jgi:hypothetical protein
MHACTTFRHDPYRYTIKNRDIIKPDIVNRTMYSVAGYTVLANLAIGLATVDEGPASRRGNDIVQISDGLFGPALSPQQKVGPIGLPCHTTPAALA